MSALGIVAMCVAGVLVYVFASVYVYYRLVWYYAQKGKSLKPTYNGDFSDACTAAGSAVAFLPVGLGILLLFSLMDAKRSDGLPPRHVRHAEREREQEEEIERIQREIDDLKAKGST